MGQTLSNGLYLPDEGERNSYSGLEVNWRTLDALILTVNGKAAPNVANTWTAAQTFTAGITGDLTGNVTGNVTGDLTGTASKAIADEDGTSIKTGYVNVAGNQTVSGQKTFSNDTFFTSSVYHKNTTYEIGNTPASNVVIQDYFVDKNNAYTGYVRNVVLASGKTQTELRVRNKFTSGALSPTGTNVSSSLQVEVQSNGDKTLYFDGSIRNNVLPYETNTYSLGSSFYQWSSVYAQSYYYNGTAWGLDKANEWTNTQTVTGNDKGWNIINPDIEKGVIPNANKSSYVWWADKNNNFLGRICSRVHTDGTTMLWLSSLNYYKNGALDPTGSSATTSLILGVDANAYKFVQTNADFRPDINNTVNLGTSTNKWKTLNGINPGALSLPDVSKAVSIDTTDWNKTGNLISYTPPVDGWISIITDNSSAANYIRCAYDNGDILAKANGNGYAQGLSVFLPVVKNVQVGIRLVCTTIGTAKFYPCLGNV